MGMTISIKDGKIFSDGTDISDAFLSIKVHIKAELGLRNGNSITIDAQNINTSRSKNLFEFNLDESAEYRFKDQLAFKQIVKLAAKKFL
jgi:hypothetical protein